MKIEQYSVQECSIENTEKNATMGHFTNMLYDTYLQIPIDVNMERGQSYVLHGQVASPNGNVSISYRNKDNSSTITMSTQINSVTKWTDINVPIESLQGNSIDFCFSPGEYFIHHWKLEKGTTATAWTASSMDSKYNVLQVGSELTQLADKITSKVWQTDIDTATQKINERMTEVGQDASKIYWLIKSGDSMSNMTLTDSAYTLIAKNINLKGNAIFTSFLSDDNTTINGGKIATSSITADKINVTDLYSLKATIGGYSISEYNIQGGTVGMTSAVNHGWAFWAGAEGAANSGNAAFRVGHTGELYASNADISGNINATSGSIGGWGIYANYLKSDFWATDGYIRRVFIQSPQNDTDWVFSVQKGTTQGENPPSLSALWKVTADGEMTFDVTSGKGITFYGAAGKEVEILRDEINLWYQPNSQKYTKIGKGYIRISDSGTGYWADCALSVVGSAKIDYLEIEKSNNIRVYNSQSGSYCGVALNRTPGNPVSFSWDGSYLRIYIDNTIIASYEWSSGNWV